MHKVGRLPIAFYSSPDSLAFPAGWPEESGLRQKWLAARRVPAGIRPMLATAGTRLLLRRPRAAAASAGQPPQVQLQTPAASESILCSEMLKDRGHSIRRPS